MPAIKGVSRREFCVAAGGALALSGGLHGMLARAAEKHPKTDGPSADEALKMLLDGNEHFAAGTLSHPGRSPADFQVLAKVQRPIAAVLGCADSRVPPEILFDQAIGGLFVVRVAGNYVSGAGPAVKGSLEYSVVELNVPLIVVLGHSNCGAVKAAIAQIHGEDTLPGSIEELVNSIKPAVSAAEKKSDDPLQAAVLSNVQRGVQRLKALDPLIAPLVKKGELKVVGMTYELEHGRVTIVSQ